jgi:arginine deiminase
MARKIGVTSEIGRLQKVIVHSPGKELLAVTPSNRSEYLYDDIIDLDGAKEEHRRFTTILSRFTEVIEVRDLLHETLQLQEARNFLIQRSEEATADRTLRVELAECTVDELVMRYIEGYQLPSGPFSVTLDKHSYVLPPLPNLFYTRDAAVVLGEAVAISAMRFASRWPEEALMRTIFGFHPDIAAQTILYDGSDERRHDYRVEGGDVHPISPDTVIVGVSERTSVAALDLLTEALFAGTEFTEVIAVVLPERTTAIHLDMVWTQVDRELCVAHPPAFRGPQRAPVLHRHKGRESVREYNSIFEALRDVGQRMEPIWAGGPRWENQEREQWASGCNFLAVGPGQVVAYARNDETLKAMDAGGFRVVNGESLLLGDEEVGEDDRCVITFFGSELVRGGGGPRCMTCPILRSDL